MPLVSVLLPVRNSASTLATAVRSTLRSLPRDGELVVLDDASDDDAESALEAVMDKRVRLIRNAESTGIGPARQMLLDRTDSRLVVTMDADDVSLPGRVTLQLRELGKGADFVFSPIVSFWPERRRLRLGLPLPISADAMPLHLLVHNPLCNPTMAAIRDAVTRAGGYRDVVAEDYDLWLRAQALGARMERTSLPLLAYRRHAGQMSMAAEFVRETLQNSPMRDAYEDFVLRRFGVRSSWIDALWSDESGTDSMAARLQPLVSLIESQAASLSRLDRFVLSRTKQLVDMRL